jgi:hypothetical protein
MFAVIAWGAVFAFPITVTAVAVFVTRHSERR